MGSRLICACWLAGLQSRRESQTVTHEFVWPRSHDPRGNAYWHIDKHILSDIDKA
jgi:hypothetical protein